MRKMHVFGCSHTYGQGITPQDFNPNKKSQAAKNPSMHSWGAKLAKIIDFVLVNWACPGSSNQLILDQVKKAIDPNFPYKDWLTEHREPLPQLTTNSGDIAVILFTYYNRSVYYDEPAGESDQITHWAPRFKWFYKNYTEYHINRMSISAIEHTYLYLQHNGIPFVPLFLCPIPDDIKSTVLDQIVLDASDPIVPFVYTFDEKIRMGADNDHWSEFIHTEVAKKVEPKIQSLITSL